MLNESTLKGFSFFVGLGAIRRFFLLEELDHLFARTKKDKRCEIKKYFEKSAVT